jgi:hypothetical protein
VTEHSVPLLAAGLQTQALDEQGCKPAARVSGHVWPYCNEHLPLRTCFCLVSACKSSGCGRPAQSEKTNRVVQAEQLARADSAIVSGIQKETKMDTLDP